MNISSFKKGDLITRIEPSAPLPGFGQEFGEDIRDRQYIGIPLTFLGIANGCVNVERYERKSSEMEEMGLPSFGNIMKMLGGNNGPIALPLDMWSNGWSHYIDPYKLDDKSNSYNVTKTSDYLTFDEYVDDKKSLEKALEKALEKEDYDKAAVIQKHLNDLK